MSKVRVSNFSISLDGFGAGEPQTFETPMGHAGQRLHTWMFDTAFGRQMMGREGGSTGIDNAFAERHSIGFGAEIMGRRKWGWQEGPFEDVGTEDEWKGWWGPNPPFHTPVFVMTQYPRPSLELEGGNVFHFVDGSPSEVLAMAREAAGDLDVRIGGGASIVRAFLAEDLIDEMHVVVAPIVLGHGSRLWDDMGGLEERYEVEAVSSPSGVTHLTFTKR